MKIEQRSKWTFIGDGIAKGTTHTVVDVDDSCAPWVTTWSDPVNRPTIGGFSWFGEASEFLKEFIPA